MVFTLGLLYLRKSDRVFDPLAERAIAATRTTPATPAPPAAFAREAAAAGAARRASDERPRRGQRRGGRDLLDRPLHHARRSPTGRRSA